MSSRAVAEVPLRSDKSRASNFSCADESQPPIPAGVTSRPADSEAAAQCETSWSQTQQVHHSEWLAEVAKGQAVKFLLFLLRRRCSG